MLLQQHLGRMQMLVVDALLNISNCCCGDAKSIQCFKLLGLPAMAKPRTEMFFEERSIFRTSIVGQ